MLLKENITKIITRGLEVSPLGGKSGQACVQISSCLRSVWTCMFVKACNGISTISSSNKYSICSSRSIGRKLLIKFFAALHVLHCWYCSSCALQDTDYGSFLLRWRGSETETIWGRQTAATGTDGNTKRTNCEVSAGEIKWKNTHGNWATGSEPRIIAAEERERGMKAEEGGDELRRMWRDHQQTRSTARPL